MNFALEMLTSVFTFDMHLTCYFIDTSIATRKYLKFGCFTTYNTANVLQKISKNVFKEYGAHETGGTNM